MLTYLIYKQHGYFDRFSGMFSFYPDILTIDWWPESNYELRPLMALADVKTEDVESEVCDGHPCHINSHLKSFLG